MADLPPPDHVADLPKDEPVHSEPAPIILHHAPAQPEGYVSDDDMEEDEEEDPDEDPEEEPIDQFVPKPNNDDEELEEDRVGDDDEEEMEVDEDDEENGRNDDKDDAEVINAYEEVNPLNRPPPTSDEESEFAPPVVPIADANDEPIPPVIQFGGNYHAEESSSTGTLLAGNGWVQDSIKMAKKFKEDDFRMNCHEYDITALDTVVRETRSDYSKMMKFVEGLSKQFNKFKEQSHRVKRLSRWEAWVRERIPEELRFQEEPPIHPAFAPRADDPYAMVRDAAIATREDDDDDTTAPRDSQPSKLRGSLRDPQWLRHKKPIVLLKNPNVASGSGGNGGQGVVELCRWFEKTESVFGINECAERSKVKFVAATLQDQALTCEEIQRLENELRSLKLRDTNIAAYTQRFNELALLCHEAVPSEKKKVGLYIKRFPENINGETTSSSPAVVRMAHT
ncbi:hypothetical protein Tco_0888287 [Tanacetum coccineum]